MYEEPEGVKNLGFNDGSATEARMFLAEGTTA